MLDTNFNIRPWSAEIGIEKITQEVVNSYKDETGKFSEQIYNNLQSHEFHFWVEQKMKYGLSNYVIICPFDYFSYSCGYWWETNIGNFISKLIDFDLQEFNPCTFTTDLNLNVVREKLLQAGFIENRDLQL